MADVESFYDEYVDRQVNVGVTERHYAIMGWLRKAGLRTNDQVFEIGSGVGTLTELLARELMHGGSVVGVDLSPRTIETARRRLASFANVELSAGDVLELPLDRKFDVVVLPDVIEHVPLERHARLFERIAEWVRPSGFVLLNYPNPHYLEWCHVHTPEVLQVIDQPIHADVLLSNVYPSGLYLDALTTYSVWIREGDYVMAVLRPRAGAGIFTPLPEKSPSLARRIIRRGRRILS